MARERKRPRGPSRTEAIRVEKERSKREAAELTESRLRLLEKLKPLVDSALKVKFDDSTRHILILRSSLEALIDQLAEADILDRARYNIDRYHQLEQYVNLRISSEDPELASANQE